MALSYNKVDKIITVLSPDTEITIQNLLNSIRDYEDELSSMDIPKIASCAGKESLGGGVSVGLTLTLLNDWQLAFEARSGPTYIQCKVSGGNIVATNANGAIYPTAFTQVLITASSSATQSDIAAIQYASYNGGITIDISGLYSGTGYPVGTPQEPVNNVTDALLIAADKGFTTFYITGDITLNSEIDFDEIIFIGESKTKTVITINSNADVENCEFYDAKITGTLDGGNVLKNCVTGDINYVNGYIEQCVLTGTVTLGGSEEAHFLDCWSGVVGTPIPTIDMGGSGQGLGLRNYNGCIRIKNKTGADEVSIDLNSGHVILDNTITNGEIIIRGIGKVTDNSKGASVEISDFISPGTITNAVWSEYTSGYAEDDTFGGGFQVQQTDLKKALGLLHENIYIDTPVYDDDNNLISARVRIYSDNLSVGSNQNVLAKYILNATPAGANRFSTWSQIISG